MNMTMFERSFFKKKYAFDLNRQERGWVLD